MKVPWAKPSPSLPDSPAEALQGLVRRMEHRLAELNLILLMAKRDAAKAGTEGADLARAEQLYKEQEAKVAEARKKAAELIARASRAEAETALSQLLLELDTFSPEESFAIAEKAVEEVEAKAQAVVALAKGSQP